MRKARCPRCQKHTIPKRETQCPACKYVIAPAESVPVVAESSMQVVDGEKAKSDFRRMAAETARLNEMPRKSRAKTWAEFKEKWSSIMEWSDAHPFATMLLVSVGVGVVLGCFGIGPNGYNPWRDSGTYEQQRARDYINGQDQRSLDSIYKEAVYGEEFRKSNGRNPTQGEVDDYLKSRE